MLRMVFAILIVLITPILVFSTTDDGKPVKVVTDADVTQFNYWSSDTVYNLDGFVYVEDGEVLIIEPGTVIKGNSGQAENATALVIARGGRIYAEGTSCDPIFFTCIDDDVDEFDDLPLGELGRGLWGGLIILGEATLPGTDTSQGIIREGQIEGIPETETRGAYGGIDDNDNSGVLKYVSIRHGGSEIGDANEINGLTLGAVGDGTTISYVEIFHNLDDGVEFFGGTVHCDHMVVGFVGDDAFDWDEGYRGSGQFWFAIHDELSGDRSGEHDGTWGSELLTCPTASAVISNATYFGRGAATSGQRCFELRDNTAGAYYNSVFTDHGTYGLKVEDDPAGSSFEKLQAGAIKFYNNVWYGFGDGNSSNAIANANNSVDAIVFHAFEPYVYWPYVSACPYTGIQDNHNYLSTADVVVSTGTRTPDGSLDPRVAGAGSWFLNDGSDTWAWTDPFDANVFVGYHPDLSQPDGCIDGEHYRQFKVVDYAGAFDPDADVLWIHNWTALDNYGYVADPGQMADCNCATDDEGNKPIRVIDDGDVNGWTYLSSDTVYNLDGFIYVESGDTLVIEPGTILKGNPGQAENATALIVARGGLIYAIGSECCPVIFTSIDDIVDYNDDIPLDEFGRGLWGGLILLGNAVICDSLEGQIEGIPETEPRGAYGGTDDMDSSGVLRYVSIRHGGSEIGSANEINGLTMGAVGCGTVISHIEVIHNLDDGYEWFGGSVSCDHLIAAFCGDDAFDYDECYRGGGQFWFAINAEDAGDRSGEHDGGYGDDVSACPVGTPLISNATYIGRGADQVGTQRCLEIRDAAGGAYYNSVFTEHGTYGIKIEANTSEPIDSRTRLIYQQLKFYNNVWYGFGNGNSSLAITNNDNTVDTILFRDFDPQHYDPTHPSIYVNNQNYLSSMQVVRCISRIQDEQLDPRVYGLENTFLNDATTSWTGWVDPTNLDPDVGYHPDYHADPFCDIDVPCWLDMNEVTFPGAFDPNVSMADSWVAGWSFLWCGGFFGDCDPDPSCCIIPADINYGQEPSSPDITDLVYLVNYMFNAGPPPPCAPSADVNGGQEPSSPDITDLVYLVNYMFNAGPPPPPCH